MLGNPTFILYAIREIKVNRKKEKKYMTNEKLQILSHLSVVFCELSHKAQKQIIKDLIVDKELDYSDTRRTVSFFLMKSTLPKFVKRVLRHRVRQGRPTLKYEEYRREKHILSRREYKLFLRSAKGNLCVSDNPK